MQMIKKAPTRKIDATVAAAMAVERRTGSEGERFRLAGVRISPEPSTETG